MKPRFALDLSHEAVSLLERAAGGWVRIGRASLDDPSLGDQLAGMKVLAQARAPEGFISKLILPNSQILYFSMEAPGPDQASRRARIQEALAGRTPYAVEDLVFDFSRQGDQVKVAVVARETLEEAEGFAEAYGFCPAGFVAIPEGEHFAGEPFFGLTSVASHHLPKDARFDRDQDPARVIAQADAPLAALFRALPGLAQPAIAATSQLPAELPEQPAANDIATGLAPEAEVAEAAVAELSHEESPLPQVPAVVAKPAGVVIAAAEPATETQATGVVAPSDTEGGHTHDPDEVSKLTAVESAITRETSSSDERSAPTLEAVQDDGVDGAAVDALPAVPTQENEAPFVDVTEVDVGEAEEDAPETDMPPRSRAHTDFQSRRAPSLAVEMPEDAGSRLAAILPRLGSIRAIKPRAPAATHAAPVLGAPLRDDAGVQAARPGPPGLSRNAGTTAFDQDGNHLTEASLLPGQRFSWTIPGSAPRPSVFGGIRLARTGRLASAPVMLGAAGLLMIGAIGLWAVFLGPAGVSETTEQVSETALEAPLTAAPPMSTTIAPQIDLPRPAAPIQVATPMAQPAPDASIGTVAAESAGPGALSADLLPQATALVTDPPLAAQPQPQPFGTLLRFDELGRIAATSEGVVTPDGFTLFAGLPPRLPPARSALAKPAAEPDPLADKRPRPKPADLVPTPAIPIPEALTGPTAPAVAELAPPVDPRHSARKPKTRPADILAKAEAKRQAAEAVADAAASAARAEAEAAEKAIAAASPQAVASSRQPVPRSAAAVAAAAKAKQAADAAIPPVDNSAVEAALAEAQTTAEPDPEPEPASTQEVDEPEPQEGIATLPTTRTVSKKSTLANAIDLGDINLIGIYGSSANRRALVRMPNGRYIKVQVGDRLDGGKVAAITDNELRYVKRGKTYALKMVNDG